VRGAAGLEPGRKVENPATWGPLPRPDWPCRPRARDRDAKLRVQWIPLVNKCMPPLHPVGPQATSSRGLSVTLSTPEPTKRRPSNLCRTCDGPGPPASGPRSTSACSAFCPKRRLQLSLCSRCSSRSSGETDWPLLRPMLPAIAPVTHAGCLH
jgi:hypothetical protein